MPETTPHLQAGSDGGTPMAFKVFDEQCPQAQTRASQAAGGSKAHTKAKAKSERGPAPALRGADMNEKRRLPGALSAATTASGTSAAPGIEPASVRTRRSTNPS